MSFSTNFIEDTNDEQALLMFFVLISTFFITIPIVQDYNRSARLFPQMTGLVVLIGSMMLLFKNHLPGPIRKIATENVSLSNQVDDDQTTVNVAEGDKSSDSDIDAPLHSKFSPDISNTTVMVAMSTTYLLAGWAVGLLYITPIFVFLYTYNFRLDIYKCILLSIVAVLIIYAFIHFLFLPFDQGEIIFQRGVF